MKTMVYYDLFHYPLKAPEVFRFLRSNSVSENDVRSCLDQLTSDNIIFRYGDFYSLQKDQSDIRRRLEGNKEADRMAPMALRQATLISKFPFVRGVFASGSYSKGYMDEHSDLDFFVVTKTGRLWMCRALLALYKRLFLSNSHKYFCTNYFIDVDHLDIEEKNLFTATELATLIPLYGFTYYRELMHTNRRWLYETFPNFSPKNAPTLKEEKKHLKSLSETLLNLLGAALWDRVLMKVASKRWRRLYANSYSKADFDLAFKTKAHVSKNHPRNFQRTVMEAYEKKASFYLEKVNTR